MADWLCTLAQAQAELKIDPADTVSNNWLTQNIPLVSTRINNKTRLRFVPYLQLHKYDAFGTHIDDVQRKLDLGRPILLPTKVVDAFQNNLVLNTDYVMMPQDTPCYQFELISTLVYGWSYGFGFGTYFWIAPGQYLLKILVTGMWGYRTNYPQEGWTDSLQTLGSSINASVTSLTVSMTNGGVNGTDSNGQSPAISVGNVLQLTDTSNPPNTEWMQVVAISGNTLTVNRNWNNYTGTTTAVPFNSGTEIFTWSVQPEIVRGAQRWLGYWYSRRGSYEAIKNDLSPAGAKTYVYPDDAPAEIIAIAEQTKDWRWSSV